MKFLVGLGNPGDKYKNNRHNAGLMLINYLINQAVNQNLSTNFNQNKISQNNNSYQFKKYSSNNANLKNMSKNIKKIKNIKNIKEINLKPIFTNQPTTQPKIVQVAYDRELLVLIKPQVFMNQSGLAIKQIFNQFRSKTNESLTMILEIRNLFIVHDDLDIPLGKFKIQKGVGPKLHNGIASIEQHLKTKDFWRIRIGVDNRSSESESTASKIPGEKYVLQNFTPDEKQTLLNNVFPKILGHPYSNLVGCIGMARTA